MGVRLVFFVGGSLKNCLGGRLGLGGVKFTRNDIEIDPVVKQSPLSLPSPLFSTVQARENRSIDRELLRGPNQTPPPPPPPHQSLSGCQPASALTSSA